MTQRMVFLALGAFFGVGFSRAPAAAERNDLMKKAILTDQAPKALGPYSQAVVANGFVFCSGQLGIDPATGDFVAGGVEEQTRRALRNLEAVLAAAGVSFEDVVKTGVFLKDMDDFARMNAVYAEFFKAPFPSRAAVQVARLPKDALVEIEAIAVSK